MYYIPFPRVDIEPFASQFVPSTECVIQGVRQDIAVLTELIPPQADTPVQLLLDRSGVRVETFIIDISTLVVSDAVACRLRPMCASAVRFLRAEVQGQEGTWWILQVLNRIDCLDIAATNARYCRGLHRTPTAPIRPEQYFPEHLVINGDAARGLDVFRLGRVPHDCVLSHRVLDLLVSVPLCGIYGRPIDILE